MDTRPDGPVHRNMLLLFADPRRDGGNERVIEQDHPSDPALCFRDQRQMAVAQDRGTDQEHVHAPHAENEQE